MARPRRRGVIVVFAALLMVAIVAMVAFAVDLGYIALARTELQRAVDAGALAGTAMLPVGEDEAYAAATDYTGRNLPGGIDSDHVSIVYGRWDRVAHAFVPGGTPVDSLELVANQNDQPLFFARALGRDSFDVSARAVATFRPRDIMLVLDFSGSMNEHRKVDDLKSAVDLFFTIMNDSGKLDRVGFVRYSTSADLIYPLTDDYNAINAEVQSTKATGWTNIGYGMELARLHLAENARPNAMKMMVVMTDGKANKPADRDPWNYVIEEAHLAADANVQIVTMTFGADCDKTLMDEVAEIGKGTYFDIDNGVANAEADLRAAFVKIATRRTVQLVD